MTVPPLTILGLLLICREVHGRLPATAGLVAPFGYCWPFQWGFINFALSMALALPAFALWLRLGRQEKFRLRAWLFVPIGALIWLAHGFAWAMVPEKTTEATKPARTTRPAEALNLAETRKPEEPVQAQEIIKVPDSLRSAESTQPREETKPAEVTKPAEETKPAEVTKPADADEMKPIDWTKSTAENETLPEDSPNAVYTITGRRIL